MQQLYTAGAVRLSINWRERKSPLQFRRKCKEATKKEQGESDEKTV